MITVVSVTIFDNDPNALEINFSNGTALTVYNDDPEIISALYYTLNTNLGEWGILRKI